MFANLNIKKLIAAACILFTFAVLLLINPACSGRNITPAILEDSTLVYTSDPAKDMIAAITFSERISKKSGELLGTGSVFIIKDKAKLHARIDMKNREMTGGKDLMFHIDWIDPGGKSIYIKRFDLLHNDSSSALLSSISITPERRKPGNYTLRVYYFRELIAEKYFHLSEAMEETGIVVYKQIASNIKAQVSFHKGISKKTGKPFGTGKSFIIKNKSKVQAVINISGIDTTLNKQHAITAEWIGPDNKSFYKKRFNLSSGNVSQTILSSVSISPGKRIPGNYRLEIYLLEKQIAAENFELVKQAAENKKVAPTISRESISAGIILCRRINKETGKPSGIDSVFTIEGKANVRAIVYFENKDTSVTKHYEIYLEWMNPEGNSFYKKRFIIAADKPEFSITNSISIAPEKRKPGDYTLQVFLFKELIAAKHFTLMQQEE